MQFNGLLASRMGWPRWGVAGLGTAAALVLQLGLMPWTRDGAPAAVAAALLVFAPAAMMVAWFGGFWPGATVVIVGAVVSDLLVLYPLGVRSVGETALQGMYLLTALVGVIACGALHHSRQRLREAHQQLTDRASALEDELAERHRAEQVVREMEHLARRVIDANVVGLVIADFSGNILDANDAFLALVGYSRSELEAGRLNYLELTPAELRHLDEQAVTQMRIRGRHEPFEKQYICKDGSRVPVLVGTALLPGAPEIGIGFIVDLTQQRLAQQRLDAVLSSINDHLVCYDRNWRYTFVNDKAAEVLRQRKEDLLGNCIWDLFPDAIGSQYYRELHTALAEQRVIRFEHYYAPFDTWFENHVYPSAEGVTVFAADITRRKKAEAALRDSEQTMRLLTDAMPALVCYLDDQLVYRFANHAYFEWFGQPVEQLIGVPVRRMLGETIWQRIEPYLHRALAGDRVEFELEFPHPDGSTRFVHAHYVPKIDESGNVQGIYVMAQDLTSRRRAEDALKLSEQRFAAFMNNLPGAAWLKDLHGRYVYANAEAQRIFGKPLDDLLGKTDFDLFALATAEQFQQNDRRVLEEGSVTTTEVLRQDDGAEHHSLVTKFVIPGPDGRPSYTGGVAIDITSRLAVEQALRESERRYRFLAESIPQIVFTARSDGVVNYHNEQLLRYLGTSRETLAKLGWIQFRHPDDRAHATERWNHAIATGEPYECMYRMLRGSDRTWRWHLARATPMRDEAGRIVMWFGTCTDVDDQKRAQDSLVESEQEFRAVFELAGSGKAMVDPQTGRFVRVNRKLCDMLGYSADELLAMTFNDVTHPDDRVWSTRESDRMMRGEIPVYATEKRYICKDGRIIWVSITATMIRDAEGRPLRATGVIQDITERKRAEQALRESEQSLARAQRIAGMGSWEIDLVSRQITWSDEMYRIFGVSRDRFVPTLEGVYAFIPAEEHQPIRNAIDRGIRERSPYHVDHRIIHPDGTVRHVSEQAEVIFGIEGEPLRLIGTTLDITQRKRYEEELAAANQAKDQFLAMLSHELRTPLTPVVLALDALRRDESLPPHVREDLEMISRNVGLETKLIDDLLDLTRVARGKLELHPEQVDVHVALTHAVRSCCGGTEVQDKRLTVRLDLAAQEARIRADRARLEQVFFNLLRNAVKFTPQGGAITVRTRNTESARLRIEISDTGVGIEQLVLPRLFNAFEQGNRAVTRHFGGLGLGLAICKAIVELHGGTIAAHSDGPNHGATFIVEVPLQYAPHATPAKSDGSPIRPASAGGDVKPRILFVEDHPSTAAMMLRLFKGLGYDVKSAGDVATARRLAEENPFDLVISDLGLPDGTGMELMQHLRQRYGLRGIALSGFGMEEDRQQSKAAGFVEHLVKPISFDQLQRTIDRVMQVNSSKSGAGDDGDPWPHQLAET